MKSRSLISEPSKDLKYAASGESTEQVISSIEEDWATDPEIAELKAEMKRLKNSVKRLTSLISPEEPIRDPKEITKEEIKEHKSKRESYWCASSQPSR